MAATAEKSLSLAAMRTLMGELMMDTDTVNPALQPTERADWLNHVWSRWYDLMIDRTDRLAPNIAFGTVTAGSKQLAGPSLLLEVYHAYLEAASTDIAVGPELEQLPPEVINSLQNADAAPGVIKYISFERLGSTGAAGNR